MEKKENKDICAKCGGICCKKCGCDYFVADFESMKLDYLIDVLNTGRVSVVAYLEFQKLPSGKLTCQPVMYLRARNINRGEIDLLSLKTTCASLEENGCHFDLNTRPSGGSTLVPGENGTCYNTVNRLEELIKWLPYQKVLSRLVTRFTGKSVQAKFREDVENLFFDILMHHFEGVMAMELIDVQGMLPILKEIYQDEYNRAYERYKKCTSIILQRK